MRVTLLSFRLEVDELHYCRLANARFPSDPEKPMMLCVFLGIKPFQILWVFQEPVAGFGVSCLDANFARVDLLEFERVK